MIAPTHTPPERVDAWLSGLDAAGQAIARRVVLRLVNFREGGAEAGRSQPVSALGSTGDAGRLAEVVRQLADGGVVRLDGDAPGQTAALADGAVTASPAIERWIASHGQTEQLRRQLEADAAAWQQRTGRAAEAALLDRPQLAELSWLTPETQHDIGVSEAAASFVAASRARRRRWWPDRTSMGGALAIMLILMILATPLTLASLIALTAAMIHKFL